MITLAAIVSIEHPTRETARNLSNLLLIFPSQSKSLDYYGETTDFYALCGNPSPAAVCQPPVYSCADLLGSPEPRAVWSAWLILNHHLLLDAVYDPGMESSTRPQKEKILLERFEAPRPVLPPEKLYWRTVTLIQDYRSRHDKGGHLRTREQVYQ